MWARTFGTCRRALLLAPLRLSLCALCAALRAVRSRYASTWQCAACSRTGVHKTQDEAAGLAEARDEEGAAYAELDASVLYREAPSAGVRGLCMSPALASRARMFRQRIGLLMRLRAALRLPAQASAWTPRLVLFDLCGALGGVSASAGDALGAAAQPPVVATWGGASHLVRRDAVPKSDFTRALEAEAEEGLEAEADPDARDGSEDDEREREPSAQRAPAAAAEQRSAAAAEAAAGGEEQAAQEEGELERAGAALEGRVSYWTDFLKAPLHGRSALLLPGVWHGVAPFAGFGDSAPYAEGEPAEEARERVRCAAAACTLPAPHTNSTHARRCLPCQLLRGGVRRRGGLPRVCGGWRRLWRADGGDAGAAAGRLPSRARGASATLATSCVPLHVC
jgi:hypothetical protein